ncbi:PREDICTED: sushi, nidogen and EGF-like domain-containing protein 1, partial [Priapulus caudatus]|uniref:Sushi, nidogen and EGF-like domain-containing protein 1 n=1 Tax=Priapulus caudatus TaxID=37621 RepID=A0ABM1F4A7_PRICU
VNTNGLLSFREGLPQWTPDPFPSSAPVVAPYWADVDLSRNHGHVTFFETQDAQHLNRINDDIRSTFINSQDFSARAAFVATWKDVTYFGGSKRTDTNTFQVLLVTDRVQTFAIFLYNELTWTTGTASKGDPISGLGGYAAQTGFNAGDGQRYLAVVGSGTIAALNLKDTSNVGVPGKWIFRVGSSEIEPAGCSETGEASASLLWLRREDRGVGIVAECQSCRGS